jgi:hypothetical protein
LVNLIGKLFFHIADPTGDFGNLDKSNNSTPSTLFPAMFVLRNVYIFEDFALRKQHHYTGFSTSSAAMFSFIVLLISALAATTAATPASSCPPSVGAKGVRVRVPPTLSLNPSTPWAPPPVGWYFKPWNMIYASNPQYFAFRNFNYDPTAIDPTQPAGRVNDLSSFQLPGNATMYTSYGIATPDSRPGFSAVLQYRGTGILADATSEYSIMAWGCDNSRTPYYVSYSTEAAASNTPAGIDIMSTSDKGLDGATVNALFAALKALSNPKIQPLVDTLTKMTQDGARNKLPRVVSRLGTFDITLVADECRTLATSIAKATRI